MHFLRLVVSKRGHRKLRRECLRFGGGLVTEACAFEDGQSGIFGKGRVFVVFAAAEVGCAAARMRHGPGVNTGNAQSDGWVRRRRFCMVDRGHGSRIFLGKNRDTYMRRFFGLPPRRVWPRKRGTTGLAPAPLRVTNR